jgi:hypothetical protein
VLLLLLLLLLLLWSLWHLLAEAQAVVLQLLAGKFLLHGVLRFGWPHSKAAAMQEV